mmetsp:Transcript_42587/g.83974  ORF Transcript_42587/g.83974 Transcript_42587/m.83974 type:complete len:258 (+) Transcript_42587:202-975(+)
MPANRMVFHGGATLLPPFSPPFPAFFPRGQPPEDKPDKTPCPPPTAALQTTSIPTPSPIPKGSRRNAAPPRPTARPRPSVQLLQLAGGPLGGPSGPFGASGGAAGMLGVLVPLGGAGGGSDPCGREKRRKPPAMQDPTDIFMYEDCCMWKWVAFLGAGTNGGSATSRGDSRSSEGVAPPMPITAGDPDMFAPVLACSVGKDAVSSTSGTPVEAEGPTGNSIQGRGGSGSIATCCFSSPGADGTRAWVCCGLTPCCTG